MHFLLPLLVFALATPPAGLHEPAITYWKAASNGSSNDACHLGACYIDGSEGAPQDNKQAVYWLQKSADAHSTQAEWFLGAAYMAGALGLETDMAKGYSLVRKAAEGGDDRALMRSFICLYNGEGCAADQRASFAPLVAAGFGENAEASCALAKLFAAGDDKMGVPRNMPLAYLWSSFAATLDLKPDDAKANKQFQEEVETQLSKDDLARLKTRWQEIEDCRKKYNMVIIDTGAGESITLPPEGITLKGTFAQLQFADGSSHDFSIDTGTTMSLISPELAHRLKLKEIGVAPPLTSPFASVAPVVEASGTLNGVPFHNLRLMVVDMARTFPGVGVDGLLAGNFIRLMRVKLDGPRYETTLLPPANAPAQGTSPGAASTSVPLHFTNGVPEADVTVESISHQSFSAPALIDTGNQEPAIMNSDLNADHPFSGLVGRTGILPISDIEGISYNKMGRLASLTLGPCRLPQPLFVYQPGTPHELNLGVDAFAHCVATFDYANARLDLVATEITGAADDPYCDIGYRAVPEAGNIRVVADVFPGGPAEQAGLKVGDVFQSIDGKPAASFVGKDMATVFPAGSHTLVVKRGDKSVTLTLVMQPPI
jgi:hypothetical protein